jgi:pyruvate/2-oxoglutarate/acetoin dehydrogenase E1 component
MTTEASVLASLNAGLRAALADDARVIVLGEDVLDPYGGAFRVTRGLSEKFPGRVMATPISEAGIVAVATGLALRGFRPVAEIMFGDFLFLAGDQIVNHAAKYRAMFNDQVRVPLVIRAPMGGRRGYGPTHSQSLEKHFLGVPGLWVAAPHPLIDPGALLRQAIALDDPVLFVENKIGYGEPVRRAVEGYEAIRLADAAAPFPTVWLKPQAPTDGLLICYGGMTPFALAAARHLRVREALHLGLVVVSQLSPAPVTHLEAVLRDVPAVPIVTVEEAPAEGGWGAEIVATIAQLRDAHGLGSANYRRVGAKSAPIPSARALEDAMLPQAGDIVAAVLACF